jgi:hypothetical protein
MEIENTQDQEEEIEESGEIGIDDESQEMVDVSMKETAPPAFSEPQPGENLVTRFTTSQLAAVSSRVISDFDADWQSGEGWRKAVAEHLDLYNGVLPDASGGGPNIHPRGSDLSFEALRKPLPGRPRHRCTDKSGHGHSRRTAHVQ